MNFRVFLKHYKRLAKNGWKRADDDIQIRLKRPGVKRKTYHSYSFSPLSAVYYSLTGRRAGWNDSGTFFCGLKMNWGTVMMLEHVTAYPNHDHPHDYWKWGMKERLMKLIPVG